MKKFLVPFIAATTVAAIFSLCPYYAPTETDAIAQQTYTVTYADGNTVLFTKTVQKRNCAELLTPPDREGYVFSYWSLQGEPYDFETHVTGDITLNAEWSLQYYTLNFVADGRLVLSETFTVKNSYVTPPALPEKPGYEGAWEEFNLGATDLTVNAVYSPITYYVRFYCDSVLIAEVPYTVENTTITEPAVPESEGRVGKWQEYELTLGDIDVEAIYEYADDSTSDGQPANPDEGNRDDDNNGENNGGEDLDDGNASGTSTSDGGEIETGTSTSDGGDTENGTDNQTDEKPHISNEFYYEPIEGGCKITGLKSNETAVYIPSVYNGLKVLEIGGFEENASIKSLVIENGVKVIDKRAFKNCTALEEVVLPESLESIGDYAFSKTAIKELYIPSLLDCGSYAFERCKSLISVRFGDKVESIGFSAFYGSENLERVYFGANVKSISYSAFANCDALNYAEFISPDGWTYADGGSVKCDFSDADAAAKFLLSMSDDICR